MFRLLQIILFYLMLLWLGLMLLAGNLLALPLLPFPIALHARVAQAVASLICRVFLASCRLFGLMYCDLSALDRLRGQERLLLVPNHPAMIDAFLVLSRLPRVICLMKGRLQSNLFLGAGAKLAGYVSNTRTDQMLREAIAKVRRGECLLLFPEGTRTTIAPVNPFQRTAALIAQKANARLQPVFIYTNSPYLTKHWPIWRPPAFPVCYRIALGEPLSPGENAADVIHQLQSQFDQQRFIDPVAHHLTA